MNRRPEVSADIKEQIEDLRAQAREAYRDGKRSSFAKSMEQAWALLPDPKAEWDYYPETITRSLVRIYLEMGDVSALKRWIAEAYVVYDDPRRENLFVLMLEGESLFKLDLLDEAYGIFDRVYTLFGRDGFKGEHLQYLEFYLKKRAGNDG